MPPERPAKNRRRLARVSLRYGAAILGEGKLIAACTMLDISLAGARLQLAETAMVPQQFTVALSRNGEVRRRCELMWRSENEIGVRFIGMPGASIHSPHRQPLIGETSE